MSDMKAVMKDLVRRGIINDNTPSADVFDIDYFKQRLGALKTAFPEDFFLHAMALKANSIRGVVQMAKDLGFGVECASISEAVHGLALGVPAKNVVYDSPTKTKVDLKTALDNGIIINLDNEREMAVVDALLKNECRGSTSQIGLRINPVVGAGSIDIISTATKYSKFGLPLLEETKDRILDLYEKYDWLSGIHIHVGSQGVPLMKFVDGTKVCASFVNAIETRCGRALSYIDIGGGLSTSYTEGKEPEGFAYQAYRKELETAVPEFFSGKYRIVTEFGRSLLLKAGKTLSRIEYIKQWVPDVKPILMIHVGVNQFIRETYLPQTWSHRFSVYDAEGVEREGEEVVYDIAGPCCFQGDYLSKDVSLPSCNIGDILMMHDTGAYGMAMYSKFNSILPSPVYGYSKTEDGFDLFCFKERETSREALQFWGNDVPRKLS